MFFSGFFAAYYALRAVNEPWPPAGVELEAWRTAAFTLLLVASSGTYHVAAGAAEHGDRQRALRWTIVTAALGFVFLGNQALEYAAAGFDLGSHAYGTIFYLMTGFHGLHVFGGLALMFAVLGVAGGGRAPLGELVTVSEYYWHFVDVVWIGMFSTIYLVR